jgi:hypothetical protein
MITKDQELKTIKETAAKLGPNSYLGPWLDSVAFELEAMMRADSFPCVSLDESRHFAEKIVTEAERKAETIIANAKREANDRERLIDDQRERARALIIGAQQSLLAIEERL